MLEGHDLRDPLEMGDSLNMGTATLLHLYNTQFANPNAKFGNSFSFTFTFAGHQLVVELHLEQRSKLVYF